MKTSTKFAIGAAAMIAVSAGVAGVTAYAVMQNKTEANASFYDSFQTVPLTRTAAMDAANMQPVDLTKAAESSLNSVVHIMAIQRSKTQIVQGQPDIFDFFFGDGRGRQREVQTPEQRGFGSGVIISKDGYIVTNNHVVDDADEISVKLHDSRELKGRVIGTDPDTDFSCHPGWKLRRTEGRRVGIGRGKPVQLGFYRNGGRGERKGPQPACQSGGIVHPD